MSDELQNPGTPSDDMSEYLQMFLDETEEQLEDLVETMLLLERAPDNAADLNEAFRLIHSIKGSAGIMGFESIAILTHHLESRFERLRSGLEKLDSGTINLVLRCIDFLRECTARLRAGQDLSSVAGFLDELSALPGRSDVAPKDRDAAEDKPDDKPGDASGTPPVTSRQDDSTATQDAFLVAEGLPRLGQSLQVTVYFESKLQLADLKARLIVSRLSGMGDLKSTRPELDDLEHIDVLTQFAVVIDSEHTLEELHAAANVDGVESIEVAPAGSQLPTPVREEGPETPPAIESEEEPPCGEDVAPLPRRTTADEPKEAAGAPADESFLGAPAAENGAVPRGDGPEVEVDARPHTPESIAAEKAHVKVGETMRVDIDRLDDLMNLAGELVVNRARFVQVSGQLSPALKKAGVVNRVREFGDTLRRTIESLQARNGQDDDLTAQIQDLEAGLAIMDEQSELWDESHRSFCHITEAIDQLTRVSDNLQRGVLGTRMVPVAPLFNRFRRVVRDLSMDRGKKVNLQIRGEKTELDKRMIDELGDPLVHLVRNSIDHGLEPPATRIERGKAEVGTISLEASHSGNSIFIHIRDDGGGINVQKIKQRLVENGLLTASAAEQLSDEQAIDYIWHPGFSTASEITDVSGRGVGMDVVKTRISDLNGTIEIASVPDQGTTFSLRLPLTLAIITSLLVRIRGVVFSIPIDDVREIVSVRPGEVVSVRGKRTFEVREEFIPLIGIGDVFRWHNVEYDHPNSGDIITGDKNSIADVVILQSKGQAMGLRVDEMLGSTDIVIKSLSENFVDIRGLSGASVLGDGTVCLMLDVGQVINMATSAKL